MDFARRFVNPDNEWNNRSLAQLSLQYTYSDLFAATDGFHEKNKIGTGSYGAVFKGVMGDGTEVAIKVMDLPSEAGFEDEVRVLSKFRHPNLVILMGFAVNGSQRLLVYEYLSGGDVSRRLQKCARDNLAFTAIQRLSVALDAACGLSHLHNANPKVFHRDIKTANILLDRNGGAKMADFGLACLSRSSEHKVKQASGTIGYACPYYIQRGVVTEGSEVYSFGMVLIELLCNAPPACSGPNPGEILYLVNHLQGSVSRCAGMADPKAGWSQVSANKVAELAMNCVSMTEQSRPKFVQIVKQLRALIEQLNSAAASSPPVALNSPCTQPPVSFSPTKRGIDLLRLDYLVSGRVVVDATKFISHTCSVEESLNAALLPALKVGRHLQSALFDALVPTDNLKGTISREHFVISFQPVTRSAERLFHATLTNNSINSISVNDKVLEKGQSSFLYAGDSIAFLALQPGAQSPSPFLAFKVEILSQIIQALRPLPQPAPFKQAPSSVASLPAASSQPQSVESLVDPLNLTHIASTVAVPSFWLQVKGASKPDDALTASEPSALLRVGRSFQPESFWRSLAPDACPAISREHFTVSAMKQRSGSVLVAEFDDSASLSRPAAYKFFLCCNSLNGLAVINPQNPTPVFLQKDSPGAGAFEIFDSAEIELAGSIRLVFRETLSQHHTTASSSSGSTASGTRSINLVPAAVLKPPVNVVTAHSSKGPLHSSFTGSANASYIASDNEIEDAFSKTGFRGAAS